MKIKAASGNNRIMENTSHVRNVSIMAQKINMIQQTVFISYVICLRVTAPILVLNRNSCAINSPLLTNLGFTQMVHIHVISG